MLEVVTPTRRHSLCSCGRLSGRSFHALPVSRYAFFLLSRPSTSPVLFHEPNLSYFVCLTLDTGSSALLPDDILHFLLLANIQSGIRSTRIHSLARDSKLITPTKALHLAHSFPRTEGLDVCHGFYQRKPSIPSHATPLRSCLTCRASRPGK